MVASLNPEVLDAKAASDTRASVVSSTKMHLGISLAVRIVLHRQNSLVMTYIQQMIHLRETGGIPKEISDAITELLNTLGKRSVTAPPQQSNPALPSYHMQDPPLKVPMKTKHTPRDDREVMAQRGDNVVVYGWTGFEAISYNTRNKTTGRVSQTLLDMDKQEECKGGELYLATLDGRPTDECPVSWKKGNYIRIWNQEDESNSRASGFCFNLASGQIGRFYTNASFSLKLVD